ncbi:hypothetical protein SAMN05421741_12128 [Paenimyroides ummariense]|uniref:Uncharacterized protein n=1 Tax=Paenimyroides ummariense TaxID=913024 RepID=A0A1I5ELH9_9FLAO|nr:hypothetical protein [Paenimyroides ummariense]SFO12270.1 hypothetical protein SAMN05421741_12128 [Paenimyroides ummariense]
MQNIFSKRYDGVNLYLEFTVKTKLIGKLVLSLFILLCFIVIFYLTISSSKDENNNSEFITAAIIFTFVLIVFPVRYLIWNCYGKEFLIINDKSLSYYYSYKFLETNLKTKLINELSIAIEVVKEDENYKYGRLIFYNINEETKLNEFLFQTSVLLKYENLEIIRKEILDLFFDNYFKEINNKKLFSDIYLN